MINNITWLPALATIGVLVFYEIFLAFAQRRNPSRFARTAHATLREEWFAAISAQKGSEILAVQTLRNSMMSATMTASTAALGLIGTITLSAPSLHAGFGEGSAAALQFTVRLMLELVLMALLFASLVFSTMAVRFYNHAGFICAMPVDSEARRRWTSTGTAYLRRAGLLYSWGVRQLVLVAPILASILYPAVGPIAAIVVITVLFFFDWLSPSKLAG